MARDSVTGGLFIKKVINNPSVLPTAIQLPLHKGALLLCTNVLYYIEQEFLSDGKDNNEQCTRVSLPCVKGGGPRSGGRIVSGHEVTFILSRMVKKKNERCTRVSPSTLTTPAVPCYNKNNKKIFIPRNVGYLFSVV